MKRWLALVAVDYGLAAWNACYFPSVPNLVAFAIAGCCGSFILGGVFERWQP